MASSWGKSWGKSWASSWGVTAVATGRSWLSRLQAMQLYQDIFPAKEKKTVGAPVVKKVHAPVVYRRAVSAATPVVEPIDEVILAQPTSGLPVLRRINERLATIEHTVPLIAEVIEPREQDDLEALALLGAIAVIHHASAHPIAHKSDDEAALLLLLS